MTKHIPQMAMTPMVESAKALYYQNKQQVSIQATRIFSDS